MTTIGVALGRNILIASKTPTLTTGLLLVEETGELGDGRSSIKFLALTTPLKLSAV